MMDILAEHGPVVATLLFFGVFVAVAVWAYWPGNKRGFEDCGHIPFRESRHGE
jgi:cbb3-type cytochrome oxidase subunit 3